MKKQQNYHGPQLLTADELGRRWRIPQHMIYRMCREAEIPHVRIGRRVRFRIEDVEAHEQRNSKGGDDG